MTWSMLVQRCTARVDAPVAMFRARAPIVKPALIRSSAGFPGVPLSSMVKVPVIGAASLPSSAARAKVPVPASNTPEVGT